MLKTVCVKGSIFHGFYVVVELELFQSVESLSTHLRERLKSICNINNFLDLHEKACALVIKPDVYSSIEEMMLSNEKVISFNCKDTSCDEFKPKILFNN